MRFGADGCPALLAIAVEAREGEAGRSGRGSGSGSEQKTNNNGIAKGNKCNKWAAARTEKNGTEQK